MADTDDFATLAECDPEDIEDIIDRLRQSFGIKFGKDAFAHVNTFGDLCNVFEQHIPGGNIQDCTSQTAGFLSGKKTPAIHSTIPGPVGH